MVTIVLFLFLVGIINVVGLAHRHTCNNITCLDSHSYCDKDNICRCKPEYPVHIELQSCRKGKKYNKECDFNAECYYYDKNSICSQFLYKRTCKCKNGLFYNEHIERCIKGKKYSEECDFNEECKYYDKNSYCSNLQYFYKSTCKCVGAFYYNEPRKRCMSVSAPMYKGYRPKTSFIGTLILFGLFCALVSIVCGRYLLRYVCKRLNEANATFSRNRRTSLSYRDSDRSVLPTASTLEDLPTLNHENAEFSRNRIPSHSNILTSEQGHQRSVCISNAPTLEEPLPTYDTALSLKVDEVCGPPPSYKEVFSQESNLKR